MLRFLSVRNLAVIDRLELEFEPGLNVLTGETGAGKSILVNAVGLLVGGRATADLVRTGEDTATVEAIFESAKGTEVIVRREVSAQGRSRGSIDGALATSATLRDVCSPLVDLHGQHEHQLLLDASTHLDLLDTFGSLGDLRARVAERFASFRTVREEREKLLSGEREKASRLEFLAFQLGEIDRVAPKPGEDEELSATRTVLANADKLQRLCAEAYDALYEGDGAVLTSLGVVWKKVGELAALDMRFGPYLDARAAVKSQLEDLSFFLRSYAGTIDASPARLQEVEDRLAQLERLKKKHGPSLGEVLAKAESLRREHHMLLNTTERVATIDREVAVARNAYVAAATALADARRAAAVEFSRALEKALGELAMTRTRCEVRFIPSASDAEWTDRGMEEGEFYISPNPGEDLRPLARIASGGELSRVMLALKTLASTDEAGKTLIFDEVDAGIGGVVADVVGARLQRLGTRYQVLCITHLPQIAAYAATHYRIEKSIRNGRTITDVARVEGVQREQELARMIGGSDLSAAVVATAKDMLAVRRGREQTVSGGDQGSSAPRQRSRPRRTN
jgi:DNA repair protein RecN (Recombination protein N)